MNNNLLLDLYVNGDIEKMLSEFKNNSPREIMNFITDYIIKWIEENKITEMRSRASEEYNAYDYFRDSMKKNQWWRFKDLISSERTRKMIVEKAKENGDETLTDEDWADLRAADF
jgi:hypothetical protein